jgi:hypothetical protein
LKNVAICTNLAAEGAPIVQAMDHALIREHLAFAEELVAAANEHLAKQRAIVAELERRRLDASLARTLLRVFEDGYALHVLHCERLRAELDADRAGAGRSG